MCEETEPCGGDIVGRWEIQDSCVLQTDLSALIGDQPACADVIRVHEAMLDGTLTFSADGEMDATLLNTKNVHILWSRACLEALADATVDLAPTCERMNIASEDAASMFANVSECRVEGDACDCMVTIQAPNMATHAYGIEGDTLVYGGDRRARYCVQGDALSVDMPIELATTARLTLRRVP